MHKDFIDAASAKALLACQVILAILSQVQTLDTYFRIASAGATIIVSVIVAWHWVQKGMMFRSERKLVEFKRIQEMERWEYEKMSHTVGKNGETKKQKEIEHIRRDEQDVPAKSDN